MVQLILYPFENINAQTYAAGVNTEVLKSTDNGNTWTTCAAISSGLYISSIKANSTGRLIVSKTGNIFMTSTDGGQSFSPINNGLPTYENGNLGVTTDGKFWLAYSDGETGATTGGIYVFQDNLAVSENKKSSFEIYPNPAKNLVNINNIGKNANIKITDASGKLIYTAIPQNSKESIDTSRFANGVYFIHIQTNGITMTQKLIIHQ